jgi:hypothetical protein
MRKEVETILRKKIYGKCEKKRTKKNRKSKRISKKIENERSDWLLD